MANLQAVCRLVPRAIQTRALSTSVRLGSVSMKQSFTAAQDRGIYPNTPGYQNVQKLQTEWAEDDGKMVWQKRGMRDSLPYQFTLLLAVAAVGLGFSTLWKMSWPKETTE